MCGGLLFCFSLVSCTVMTSMLCSFASCSSSRILFEIPFMFICNILMSEGDWFDLRLGFGCVNLLTVLFLFSFVVLVVLGVAEVFIVVGFVFVVVVVADEFVEGFVDLVLGFDVLCKLHFQFW